MVAALEDRDLLRVWGAAEARHPIDRTLALLAAGAPELAPDELAGLSLGARNALVLELRERTFGPRIDAFAACPRCESALELATTTAELRAPAAATADPAVAVGDHALVLRRLDSRDLAAIVGMPDRDGARRELIARAVSVAHRAGVEIDPRELPDDVIAAIGQRLAELDPQLDLQLALTCPACDHRWDAPFDPGAYLWREVVVHARRLVRDIHQLALAYGWSEDAVLAIPPARRHAYLELLGAG